MERAGDFLGSALRKTKRPEAALVWLQGAWASLVGTTLAAHTRPVGYRSGCLEISTDGKAWQKQLIEMQREFGEQVNRAWGGKLVREVKFVDRESLRHISKEFDNEHTPFVRGNRKP